MLGSLRYVLVAVLNIDCASACVMQHFSQNKDSFIKKKKKKKIHNVNATTLLRSLVDCDIGAHCIAYIPLEQLCNIPSETIVNTYP